MTQTAAIFLDAYRELNARKMFWITMIISGLVVAVFALVGINENGMTFAWWELPFPVNTDMISAETFYKSVFTSFGIGVWLAWIATILALISTASIFPDFISSGSIDLVLAKPIGRLRLFLTKYMTGLLFVGLQVAVFSAASFLVLGFRGGVWEPAVFLAVPILMVFYSYLFSVCALLGLVTRSTIAALLLTMLVWFLIFIVHSAESGVLAFRVMTEQKVETLERTVGRFQQSLDRLGESEDEQVRKRAENLREQIDDYSRQLSEAREDVEDIDFYHELAFGLKTVLPKTTETIGLLERWMIDLAELPRPEENDTAQFNDREGFRPDQERLQLRLVEILRERSVAWVLGTSVLFECVVLTLGAWIFCRRDF